MDKSEVKSGLFEALISPTHNLKVNYIFYGGIYLILRLKGPQEWRLLIAAHTLVLSS